MRATMSCIRGPRALFLLMVMGAAGMAIAAPPVGESAQDAAGTRGLTAFSTADGPVVADPGGGRTRTPLPADTRIQDIVELTDGWALAATMPTPDGQRATVLVAEDGRQRRLPRIPGARAALQERPSPLALDGQLRGLAWLEGDDYTGLAVRAADWDGRRWGPVETVARHLHGSQMALSATVLGDGSPLLVWSRFDGGDDEVVYSVRAADGWTPPRPVHPANDVPDVLPRVVATGASGALVAWSELIDGHYRVLVSRFDGTRWGMPRRLPGRGAAVAQLRLAGSQALLLYESTEPREWRLGEIDPASARPLRVARTARGAEEAPAIDSGAGATALIWPAAGRRVVPAWQELAVP